MEKVDEILKNLEEKHEITIIYAIEAGSRAWGFESEDSDYDIRFVFIYKNKRKYLSLTPIKETIDGFSEDRLYDWQGWDITKTLRLINQMNPSIVEWLFSPIVYLEQKIDGQFDFVENARDLLWKQKRSKPLLYHYRSMAKSNYKAHIENKDLVKIKKYLYVIRPAGMYEWVKRFLNFENGSQTKNENNKFEFDINFIRILDDLKPYLDKECYEDILKVIEKKKLVNELDEEPRLVPIDNWLENFFKQSESELKQQKDAGSESDSQKNYEKQSLDEYDTLLHSILNIKF